MNFSGGKATLYGQNQPVDEKLYAGVTAEEVSQYVTRNQRLLLQSLKAQDRTAREVVTPARHGQLRTTRRIAGDYALTTADQYRHFEDSVGAICDFDNRDFLYEVPCAPCAWMASTICSPPAAAPPPSAMPGTCCG